MSGGMTATAVVTGDTLSVVIIKEGKTLTKLSFTKKGGLSL
jgi:hypothetical protein